MVGVHPKVVGIPTELVFGVIEALGLTEVLWRRKKANGGGGDMMTGDEEIHLGAVLADKSPADDTSPSDSGGSVNGLHLASETPFNIGDEVAAIWRDGEGAAGVEDDVDDIVTGLSREECSNEVGIEVRTGDMCIESDG